MKNKIIGLILKFSGAGRIWSWLDGKKSNIAGKKASQVSGGSGSVSSSVRKSQRICARRGKSKGTACR